MQEIWLAEIDWDGPLLDETSRKVQVWFKELNELPRIKIPRSLQRRDVELNSLHTFVDASQCAYGGVVYVRCEYDTKTVSVTWPQLRLKLHLYSLSLYHD